MRRKVLVVIACLIGFVVLAYNACSSTIFSGPKVQGTETTNPFSPASNQLVMTICSVINRCNPQVNTNDCQNGVLLASINNQVGLPSSYSTFSEVAQSEGNGVLNYSSQALSSCTNTISSLSCSNPGVQSAYNPYAINPFSGSGSVIPAGSSCTNVYTQNVSSWQFVDGGTSSGLNFSSSQNAADPEATSLNNILYVSWDEVNSGVNQIHVTSYDGSNWNFIDGGSSTGINFATNQSATNPALTSFNNELYAAWVELNGGVTEVRVKVYGGSGWSVVDGGGADGISDGTGMSASPVLAVFNNQLFASWSEEDSSQNTHIRVKVYNGNDTSPSWSSVDGGGLDLTLSYGGIYPKLDVYNNQLYATWFGYLNGEGQIRVAVYGGGSTWNLVDGGGDTGLNYSSQEGAERPSAATFNGNLFVSWDEWQNSATEVRSKSYNGSAWQSDDGGAGLNFNSSQSGAYSDLLPFSNQLYNSWQEMNNGVSQVRVKSFNGTSWSFVDGGSASGLNYNTAQNAQNPQLATSNFQLYTIWQETNGTASQIRVKLAR